MLDQVADALLDEIEPQGTTDLLRTFAGPYAARPLKLLLGIDDASDQDMQSWSQALIDGIGNYADDQEVWRRCEHAGAEIDAALDRWWTRAGEGTVLHSLISAEDVTDDEVRANIKLFISGGLNE